MQWEDKHTPDHVDGTAMYGWDAKPIRAWENVKAQMEHFGKQLEAAYANDDAQSWRERCKILQTRVREQRGEIARLHQDVDRIRAEAHAWREKAEALSSPSSTKQAGG